MASNRYYGSINLSKLLEKAHQKHSGYARGQKDGKPGDIWVSVTIWENEVPDQYGNVLAIQVNPAKESQDEKFYIGNMKKGAPIEQKLSQQDLAGMATDDDFPF